jgi:hypothetical protein
VDITTEEELQVPNAGFEEWSVRQTWTSESFGGKKIYAYYPYSDVNNQWWDTSNEITTQKVNGIYYSWYYAVYPGVVPTNAELHTASWMLGRTDAAHSGSVAVDIATVGWGCNNWGPTGGDGTDYKTAGSLFVGVLQDKQEILGKEFNSRPSKVQFYYKYYSYNGEYTVPFVRILNKDGNEVKILGVERIKDEELLQEIIEWKPGRNVDRITSFGHALVWARYLDDIRVIPKVKGQKVKKMTQDIYNEKMDKIRAGVRNKYGTRKFSPYGSRRR